MRRAFEDSGYGYRTYQIPPRLSPHSQGDRGFDECPAQFAEGDRLDVLVTLVEAWERKQYLP
jgi:hypothetical protein